MASSKSGDLYSRSKKVLQKDPVLSDIMSRLVELPDRRQVHGSICRGLLSAIIGQQISLQAATSIRERFTALYDGDWPSPEQVLTTDVDELRAVGLSRSKVNYVRAVAEYLKEHTETELRALSDEDLEHSLLQVRGVGPWTVRILMMFTLHRTDVLPLGDLVIRQMIAHHYDLDLKAKGFKKQAQKIAEAWVPYRSHACFLLWGSYRQMKEEGK